MDIESLWGGGVDITVVASTGERLALNPTGDGVRVWYIDTSDNTEKVMDVTLAGQRYTCEYVGAPSHNLSIPGLYSVARGGSDAHTAKYNTEAILAFIDDLAVFPDNAAEMSRRASIAGTVCNLPNVQQTKVIYRLRDIIDSLDSTVSTNYTKRLGNWGFGASSAACWSSSIYDSVYAWSILSTGSAFDTIKSIVCGVIPILELDPVTLVPLSS